MNLPPLINLNSHKFVVIIPAAGISERLANSASASNSRRNSPARILPGMAAVAVSGPIDFSRRLSSGSGFALKNIAQCKNEPKQYQIICDRPLIFHTVTAFLKLKWVDHVLIIAPPDSLSRMEKTLTSLAKQQQKRFDCIAGSRSRHRSIREALNYLAESRNLQSQSVPPDIVIIHDGARPFVDGDTLHQLVSNGYQFGAAGVVCKLTSTVISAKEVNAQLLQMKSALNREKYVASETPQAFRYNLLCDAYAKCTDDELDHNTECLDLVQRYTKTDARLIHVDPNLYFKVTYRKDLYAADNILKERRNVLLHCDFIEKQMNVNFRFIKQLKDDLCANFSTVNFFNNSNITDKYQSNVAIHSTGFVHIVLHYCHTWTDIVRQENENNISNYESLIYIVVVNATRTKCVKTEEADKTMDETDVNEHRLDDSAYPQLIQWSKRRVPMIKNFYLILVHSNNLDQDSQRIRSAACYLCKELPGELTGQCFFM